MIQMAKDFQAEIEKEKDLGLNPDELAFYDALANNVSRRALKPPLTLSLVKDDREEKGAFHIPSFPRFSILIP